MLLSFVPYALEFTHPFTVHGNTRLRTPTVLVRIQSNGCVGYGEACIPPYLGETVANTTAFLNRATQMLNKIEPELGLDLILNILRPLMSVDFAGMAALDIALHDLFAKLEKKTLRQYLGLKKTISLETAHTIGIGDTSQLAQKILEAKDFKILKIKLGTKRDQEIIEFIREHSNKPLYVDVNQGWRDKEDALKMINWLHTKNVVLVEQPLPVSMKQEMIWITERSPIPTIADESVKRLSDLYKINGSYSGINVKLMKSTGMNEALKIIAAAKDQGLKVMLGCMAESTCGTTAMAQFMQYADFIDLDAPLLYKNDPFTGLHYKKGKIILNNKPGLGVEPISTLLESNRFQ